MAVGTNGSYARTVGVVYGLLVFRIDIVFHYVAGDTKSFGIGIIQGSIESGPENEPK